MRALLSTGAVRFAVIAATLAGDPNGPAESVNVQISTTRRKAGFFVLAGKHLRVGRQMGRGVLVHFAMAFRAHVD